MVSILKKSTRKKYIDRCATSNDIEFLLEYDKEILLELFKYNKFQDIAVALRNNNYDVADELVRLYNEHLSIKFDLTRNLIFIINKRERPLDFSKILEIINRYSLYNIDNIFDSINFKVMTTLFINELFNIEYDATMNNIVKIINQYRETRKNNNVFNQIRQRYIVNEDVYKKAIRIINLKTYQKNSI